VGVRESRREALSAARVGLGVCVGARWLSCSQLVVRLLVYLFSAFYKDMVHI
jgi:hypothetical protein